MSDDNKDYKGFSFIQEQITSKKKSRIKRMILSLAWTIVLACVFGVVAGVAFCVSEPTISKMFAKEDDKKTVKFPSLVPDESSTIIDNQNVSTNTDVSFIPSNNPEDNKDDNSLDVQKDIKDIEDIKNTDNSVDNTSEGVVEPAVIEKPVPANKEDLSVIYSELYSMAKQAEKSIVKVNNISSDVDLFLNEYELAKSTTGLIVANNEKDLLILVSYNKIKDAKDIKVTLADSTVLDAKLLSYETELNLAIVTVSLDQISEMQLKHLIVAELGESLYVSPGTQIIAVGAPNGFAESIEYGFVTTKLTPVYTTDNKIDLFYTSITNNENSEGVIVNIDGKVIGIITHHLDTSGIQEVSSAIGISQIKKVIERLVNNSGHIYFGIKGMNMTDAAKKQFNVTHGIYITEVKANSPALEAGLQGGDIILSMNNTNVISVQSFNTMLSTYEAKTPIQVKILRTSKSSTKDIELTVTVGKRNY